VAGAEEREEAGLVRRAPLVPAEGEAELALVDVADAVDAGAPSRVRRLARLAVDAAVVLEVHPREESLVELVERADARGLHLRHEGGLGEPVEGFNLAVALGPILLREDDSVDAERRHDVAHVARAIDLAVVVVDALGLAV